MNTFFGVYMEHPNNYEEKKLSFIIEGFEKIGLKCLGTNSYKKFDNYLDTDLIVGSGGMPDREVLKKLNKYKHVVWRDQCCFHKFYNGKLGDVNYLYYLNDREGGSIYSCIPVYSNNLPDDRCKMFGIDPRIHKFEDKEFVIVSHNYANCFFYKQQIEFYDKAITYLLEKNIKFKFCMHPGVEREYEKSHNIKEIIIDKFSKMGVKEFLVGAYNYLDDAKCVICNSGRIVNECIIKGVPVYSDNNIFTNDILENISFEEFIRSPYITSMIKRKEWLSWLSYMNWTNNEFRNGVAQEFLLDFWNLK